MELNNHEKKIIDELLLHDLSSLAYKLDLIGKLPILDDSKAVTILNILERLTHIKNDSLVKELCITIIGLIWEHKKKEWLYIIPFLSQMLSRLNLIPSASMLNKITEDDKFINFNNLLAEFRFSSNLIKHRITINDYDLIFSEFQMLVWHSIDKYDRIGISAPTSAGKSFSLSIKLLSYLNEAEGNAIYIVPTITLINQVSRDLRNAIKKYGFKDFHVAHSYSKSNIKSSGKYIYVLTQERTISAVNQNPDEFFNIDMLIIDEVQNIERVANEDNDRSRDLYDLIHELAKHGAIDGENKYKVITKHFLNKKGTEFKNLAQKKNYTNNYTNSGNLIREIMNKIEF
jgi:hypothetical protein